MHNPTYRIVYTGIFAVLLAICSWISFPTLIPFTLQTFGFFFHVFPLIIPDLCKLFLACALSRRLKPLLKTRL